MEKCNMSVMTNRSQDSMSMQYPIGMAYVPWQSWRNIYEPDKALQRGTIFEELDKPFYGAKGAKR